MDYISILVASILFCFFASNYSLKYKENRLIIKEYINISMIISFLGEIFMFYGFLNANLFYILFGIIILGIILFFQLYISIKKINYFNKNKMGKSNYECTIISLSKVFKVISAPLYIIQIIIENLFELMLYNK